MTAAPPGRPTHPHDYLVDLLKKRRLARADIAAAVGFGSDAAVTNLLRIRRRPGSATGPEMALDLARIAALERLAGVDVGHVMVGSGWVVEPRTAHDAVLMMPGMVATQRHVLATLMRSWGVEVTVANIPSDVGRAAVVDASNGVYEPFHEEAVWWPDGEDRRLNDELRDEIAHRQQVGPMVSQVMVAGWWGVSQSAVSPMLRVTGHVTSPSTMRAGGRVRLRPVRLTAGHMWIVEAHLGLPPGTFLSRRGWVAAPPVEALTAGLTAGQVAAVATLVPQVDS